MRKNNALVALWLLAACVGPAACSSEPEALAPELGARLEADTGVPWTLHIDEQSKAVRFLAPTTPVKTTDASPEAAARAFFDRYRDALYGGDGADEVRLVPKNEAVTPEEDGAYVRFQHYLKGTDIRVLDVASTARFTTDGALVWLQSGFRADLGSVPRTAAFAATEAVSKATARSIEVCGEPVRQDDDHPPVPMLGVSVDGPAPRLVWRVQMMRSTERCTTPTVTVDATSGEVLELRDEGHSLWDDSPGVRAEALGETSNIRRIDVTSRLVTLSGKYYMLTESLPAVNTSTYGTIFNSEISTDVLGSWDTKSAARGAAVDAHYNVMHALRYFREAHGRRSTTGFGNPISVVVHFPFKDEKGKVYETNAANNAFAWVTNEMQCGDGNYLSGGDYLPLCSSLDVTAHEIAHGVTHYTSGLVYKGESGALNESFSDVMAASAENALEVDDPARNFLIGERVMKSGVGLRDMRNPRNGFPDHYEDVKPCAMEPRDQCSVHSNSSISNRAFALMTVGGLHAKHGIGVPTGIGWRASRELWYDTFTKLSPDADIKTAALVQVTEALRRGPNVLQAVGCAWYAVGAIELDVSPMLTALACPAPGAPVAPPGPKAPDCQGRDNGWFCSGNVLNSAVHCKGGAVDTGAFCADRDQKCKKAAVDDWTANVSASGEVVCE